MLFWAHLMLLARTKQEEQSPNLPKKGTTNTQFFTTLHFDSRLTQYKIHHTHCKLHTTYYTLHTTHLSPPFSGFPEASN